MTTGPIRKMQATAGTPIRYELPVGNESLPLNDFLGRQLTLQWSRRIECVHCGRQTKQSFQQGYCFPCMRSLACCDSCIVRPELCHYLAGTCREPEWGEKHCLIPHTVYLANSSGLKVGITRGLEPFGRWTDQGASQGLTIRIAASRLEAGRIEVSLKQHVSDRTNWRAMLRGRPEARDLVEEQHRLLRQAEQADGPLKGRPPEQCDPVELEYPVLEYPRKIVSRDLVKDPLLEGTLLGIKGQYLMLDTAVINVRKHAGFVLEVR